MDMQNMSAQEIMELQKKNCIFCKILAKEIPSQEIYSDEKVSVILDINPASEGHCLILPKAHYQILPQIPEDLIGYLFVVAKKTSRVLLKALGIKGTTIFVANGAIAGQKAPHFMIHVTSRKHADMMFDLPKTIIDENKLIEIQEKLSALLGYRSVQKMDPSIHETHEKQPQIETSLAKEGIIHKKDELHHNKKAEHGDKEAVHETDGTVRENEQDQEPEGDEDEGRKDLNIDDIANLFLK